MEAIAEAVKFETYPVYKDSGVDWLGTVPEHWEVKKLKFIGKIYAGINDKKGADFSKEHFDGMKPFVPFTNICNNFEIFTDKYQYVNIHVKENQNRVEKNDILFLMSSETLEEIAKCSIYLGDESELYLNSFCKGFRISLDNIYPKFIAYLLSSLTYRNYFSLVGRGFTRINIKQDFINDAFSLLPPLREQTAIANFLDSKTKKIDEVIAQKEKQIELLKERRQVMIHKAVTRGLNPDVALKDSGVEWIGEIPEHWDVKRLKYLGGIRYGLGQPPKEIENGLPIIRATNVERGKIVEKGLIFVDPNDIPWERNPQLKENEIIVVRSGAYTADSAIVTPKYAGAIAGYDMVFTPLRVVPKFLSFVLLTKYILYDQLYLLRLRAAQPHLNAEELAATLILCPPLNEQENLAKHLELLNVKVDIAISCKEKEIEKLKEYKVTLINSAVTGEIKVS